jgi:hypothetical protein
MFGCASELEIQLTLTALKCQECEEDGGCLIYHFQQSAEAFSRGQKIQPSTSTALEATSARWDSDCAHDRGLGRRPCMRLLQIVIFE